MIVWINGSFGVGKTTIAKILKEKLDNAVIYDPEVIGDFLMKTVSEKKNDFQDYELWREINNNILKRLNKKYKFIIVPMTITNRTYFEEIIKDLDEVKHFILIATKKNIMKRLKKRKNSTEWAYNQVDRCINTFNNNSFEGIRINTNNTKDVEAAMKILSLIDDS